MKVRHEASGERHDDATGAPRARVITESRVSPSPSDAPDGDARPGSRRRPRRRGERDLRRCYMHGVGDGDAWRRARAGLGAGRGPGSGPGQPGPGPRAPGRVPRDRIPDDARRNTKFFQTLISECRFPFNFRAISARFPDSREISA